MLYGTAQATTWQTTFEPQYNQPLVSTDPLGRKTTRVYDAKGVLQEVHDDLVKVTDPKGRSTQFNVDALGRVIRVSHAVNESPTKVNCMKETT